MRDADAIAADFAGPMALRSRQQRRRRRLRNSLADANVYVDESGARWAGNDCHCYHN